MIKAHFLHYPAEPYLEMLLNELDDGIQVSGGALPPGEADYAMLIGGNPSEEDVNASPNLRFLVIPFAGIPEPTRELMLNHLQVSVHNLHHNAAPTAETGLALLFAAAKFIVPFDRSLRANDWTPRYQGNPARLLCGKTALVLGFGEIGQRIARVCNALEMEVLALRKSAPEGGVLMHGARVFPAGALHELLVKTDVLIVTLPLTDETRGLIGKRELGMMCKGGILVNVGRGPVVDQEALYQALTDGTLSAAGLDVWYNYPTGEESRRNTPPSDFPFTGLDNVVLSPHRGGEGGTLEVERLRMKALASLMNNAARGLPVPNQVNLHIGY